MAAQRYSRGSFIRNDFSVGCVYVDYPSVTLGYRTSCGLRARKSLVLKGILRKDEKNLQSTDACMFGK